MKRIKAIKMLFVISGYTLILRAATKAITGFSLVAQVWVIGLIANAVVQETNFFIFIALYFLLVALSGLDSTLQPLYEHLQSHQVEVAFKQRLLQMQSTCYIEDLEELRSKGELAVAKEGILSANQVINYVLEIIERVIYLSGIVIIVAQLGWLWVLIAAFSLVPSYFLKISGSQALYALFKQNAPRHNYASYLFNLFFEPKYVKEIRWLACDADLKQRRDVSLHQADRESERMAGREVFQVCLAYFLAAIGLALLCYNIATQVGQGNILLGTALSLLLAAIRLMTSGSGLMRSIAELIINLLKTQDVQKIIELPLEANPSQAALDTTASTGDALELTDVTFSYKNSAKPALKNINCRIPLPSMVVIVGENGSGKSSLLNIMLGILRPQQGVVVVHRGAPLAVVMQVPVKYQLSLGENVGFGDTKRLEHKESIAEKLAISGLDAAELGGLDQNLGVLRPNSRDLSTGQWQRLALARALFSDSPLLILDEPTAYMDPESEVGFFETLSAFTTDKALVIATHRIGLARKADLVLVLKEGDLVEQGTHAALLQNDGHYRALYQAQAHWYATVEAGEGHAE